MAAEKIRIRNLDQEVLNYFISRNNQITYDQLSEDITTEIKNGEGTQKYNDAELRKRIENLELINNNNEKHLEKLMEEYRENIQKILDEKINTEEASKMFIQNKNEVISEFMLSQDLSIKVNARYQNQTQTSTNSSIDEQDYSVLKKQVSKNTKDISSINDDLENNYFSKTIKINKDLLDDSLKTAINQASNARSRNDLITYDDLDGDVQKKLENTEEGKFENLEVLVNKNTALIEKINKNYLNVKNGEIIIGAKRSNSANNDITISHSMILLENVTIIPNDSKLTEVQNKLKNEILEDIREIENDENLDEETRKESLNEIKTKSVYIIDANTNDLYTYVNIKNEWLKNKYYVPEKTNSEISNSGDSSDIVTDENPGESKEPIMVGSELLAGKFALEYETGNLYFGTNEEEIDIIIDFSILAKKTDLNQYLKTSTAANTYVKNVDFADKVASLNIITQLEQKIETLESTITALASEIEKLKSPNTEVKP